MANIKNTEGLSKQQLADYIKQGGKFVIFQYTVSIVVMTFKKNSSVYFIKPGEGTFKYAWPHTFLTLLMGWWGIPWGPIYTIGCLVSNLGGGKDFTNEFANQLGLNNHSGYNIPGNNSGSNSGGYNIPGSNNNNNQSGGYNIPR